MRWVTWLVTGAMFMEILDGAIIGPALPAMARAFGVTPLELNIGISAYLLAVGIFIPASGWIADRYGTRRVFMGAIALFTVSSALCAMVHTLPSFVAVRIVQGFSGALMVPVGRLVILRKMPQERLMAAMSALVWPALVAPVLGPPLGGFIAQHIGWHWIFLMNVPLGVLALFAAWRLVPDVRGDQRTRFDWPGFLLCGAGTFTLLSGLERLAGQVDAVNLLLCGGGLVLLTAAFRHFGRASEPMLALTSLSVPTFRITVFGGTMARMAIGAAPFLLVLMFQVGFGHDATTSGLLVLALFAGNLLMKTITTQILRVFGYRRVLLGNGALCAASLVACAALNVDTPLWLTVLVLLFAGMTRSMQFTALGTIGFADIPKQDMAHANGLSNTISQLGMAAGITLAAMSVRVAHTVLDGPAANDYRIAFLVLALAVVASLVGIARLPRDAGNHFIDRGKRGR
ncbi:MFS transporter [Duganella sp. FT80W]|uniref:MFS transporter n=1 Tax=Duganella guangzhouensis TaxID=2666084 RepID=A0A6I2L5N7_9BURK|nr:MFS transporter [Duganella guangzhouensis]